MAACWRWQPRRVSGWQLGGAARIPVSRQAIAAVGDVGSGVASEVEGAAHMILTLCRR